MNTNVEYVTRCIDIFQYLLQEGYTLKESVKLIQRLNGMDAAVKRMFLDWFRSGNYAKGDVEGVTMRELTEQAKMRPVNAFLTLDWLTREPDLAKAALCTLVTDIKKILHAKEDVPEPISPETEESMMIPFIVD